MTLCIIIHSGSGACTYTNCCFYDPEVNFGNVHTLTSNTPWCLLHYLHHALLALFGGLSSELPSEHSVTFNGSFVEFPHLHCVLLKECIVAR